MSEQSVRIALMEQMVYQRHVFYKARKLTCSTTWKITQTFTDGKRVRALVSSNGNLIRIVLHSCWEERFNASTDFTVYYLSAIEEIFKSEFSCEEVVRVLVDEPKLPDSKSFKKVVRLYFNALPLKLSIKFNFIPILKGCYTYNVNFPDFNPFF